MPVTTQPELIQKESIHNLKFNHKLNVKQHPYLLSQIRNATRLGNSYRSKVFIFFQDDNGMKKVETTIWAFGEKYICLKGGVWLPIGRIVEIKA